jgi:hypothetical protein
MIKQFLVVAAIAASATTTHTPGHLATKGTNGAWATERVNVSNGTSVIHVSASADGKNTPLDCAWEDPYGKSAHFEKHTLMCSATVKNLTLPSHVVLKLINEYNGPVTYDIEVSNTQ